MNFLIFIAFHFFSIETSSILANVVVFMFRSTLFNEFSISVNQFERRMLNLTLAWMFRVFEFNKLSSVTSFSKIWLSTFEFSAIFQTTLFQISSSTQIFLLIIFNFFIASIEFSSVMFSILWISVCFVNKFSTFLVLNRFNRFSA